MREVAIVSYGRSALGKANKGGLAQERPDDIAAAVLKGVLEKIPALKGEEIDDVIVGCAMPEGEQGLNIARSVVFLAGLPDSVPALTVNRFCSSGIQTVADAAAKIAVGWADVVVAGGVESMSKVPMGGFSPSPNPTLMGERPEALTGMGITAEIVAERYGVGREEQDAWAVTSHQRAAKAQAEGRFAKEIIPFTRRDGSVFDADDGIRADSSVEGLAKLKPVFKAGGTVTAANASQVTDGAAFVVLMSKEKAEALGLPVLAWFKGFQVAGVAPEEMGIGPSVAIPKVLAAAGVEQKDVDVFEINEAFAAQFLQVGKALELDLEKVNPNGGAIAIGHPLGCTGARMTATLLNELHRTGGKWGIVSMCIGGGMGAAALFERA